MAEGVVPVGQRFTFHDLRACYTTEHKALTGELPDLHKNREMTTRVYDRNKVVKRSAIGRPARRNIPKLGIFDSHRDNPRNDIRHLSA